jgi:hypothetical protein
VAGSVRGLVRWQRDLRTWTPCRRAPDAAPFVALYAGGRLCGCFGSDEGPPGERLMRAFLRALSDPRFSPIAPADRRGLVASVSYVRDARSCSRGELLSWVEPGTHGIGLLRPPEDGGPVILLPSVAREGGLAAAELLASLLRKAGVKDSGEGLQFFLFETDTVVCRPRPSPASRSACDAAAAWLARLVAPDGRVSFAVDARTGRHSPVGAMHHGRAAVVLQALAQHGGQQRRVARGRAWLEREARGSLAGEPAPGWPREPPQVAGTLALAVLGGARLRAELRAAVADPAPVLGAPWHAAQVVTALGAEAPEAIWRACVRDLEAHPWSPWTVLAARARGDAAVLEQAERALVDSVRAKEPYVGGVTPNPSRPVPETALTAVTAEALAPSTDRAAKAALARARAFLLRWQFTAEGPAMIHPSTIGAFPASPIAPLLRGDITAHALVALECPHGQ